MNPIKAAADADPIGHARQHINRKFAIITAVQAVISALLMFYHPFHEAVFSVVGGWLALAGVGHLLLHLLIFIGGYAISWHHSN